MKCIYGFKRIGRFLEFKRVRFSIFCESGVFLGYYGDAGLGRLEYWRLR